MVRSPVSCVLRKGLCFSHHISVGSTPDFSQGLVKPELLNPKGRHSDSCLCLGGRCKSGAVCHLVCEFSKGSKSLSAFSFLLCLILSFLFALRWEGNPGFDSGSRFLWQAPSVPSLCMTGMVSRPCSTSPETRLPADQTCW